LSCPRFQSHCRFNRAITDKVIDWFWLRGGKYKALAPDKGVYKSRILPGLWLDAEALMAREMAKVIEVTMAGVTSAEHEEFVQKLRKRKK